MKKNTKKGYKKNAKNKKKNIKNIIIAISVVLAIGIATAILIPTVIIPSGKYKEAVAMLDKKDFADAAIAFAELGSFKDSEEKLAAIPEMKYEYALELLKKGENALAIMTFNEACEKVIDTDNVKNIKYEFALGMIKLGQSIKAAKIFDSLGDYKDSADKLAEISNKLISEAVVGSEIVLGTFEQDGDLENGGELIEWSVVEKTDDSILVASKYALESMPYAETVENSTWEKSDIRKWLNGEFYNSAFDSREKNKIITSTVTGEVNELFGKSSKESVKDKLYLFNCPDLDKYYVTDIPRITQCTEYAKDYSIGECGWWLREYYGAYVTEVGSVRHYSDNKLLGEEYYVRPVMRISL